MGYASGFPSLIPMREGLGVGEDEGGGQGVGENNEGAGGISSPLSSLTPSFNPRLTSGATL